MVDATRLRVFQGAGQTAHETAGELSDRIKALVYEYADRIPLATAAGALDIAKLEILNDHLGDG